MRAGLVRFSIGLQGEGGEALGLSPIADQVNLRFQAWIFRNNAQRATAFTPEQTDWLRRMKDDIAAAAALPAATSNLAPWPAKVACKLDGAYLAANLTC